MMENLDIKHISLKDLRSICIKKSPLIVEYYNGSIKTLMGFYTFEILTTIMKEEKIYDKNDESEGFLFLTEMNEANIIQLNKIFKDEYSEYVICNQLICIINNTRPPFDIGYININGEKIVVSKNGRSIVASKNGNERKQVALDWEDDIIFKNREVFFKYPKAYRKESDKYKDCTLKNYESTSGLNDIKKYLKDKLEPILVEIDKTHICKIINGMDINKAITDLKAYNEKIQYSENPIMIQPSPYYYHTVLEDQDSIIRRLKSYKNYYINQLIERQDKNFNIVRCDECYSTLESGDFNEEAIIFTIKLVDNYLLIFENVNIARASLYFYVYKDRYKEAVQRIVNFMHQSEYLRRSFLRSRKYDFTDAGIWKYKSVNHV